jgi:hypothetical protein
MQGITHLLLGYFHEQAILKSVLRNLFDFVKVFGHYFDFLGT